MNTSDIFYYLLGAVFFGWMAVHDRETGKQFWMYASAIIAIINYAVAGVMFVLQLK